MMKKFFAAAVLLPVLAIGQIHFEKGYFVNNEGKKIDCLIKNRAWGNNPESFDYKISEDSEVQSGTLKEVSEFEIDGKLKYVRATVPMERSLTIVGKLQKDANYNLVPETHFFKSLFEASHSLYAYRENGVQKFFDRNDKGEMTQLIYIQYLGTNGQMRNYNYFHTQLLERFSCPATTLGDLAKVEYKESSLRNYYKKAADCKNEKVAVRESKKARIHLRPFVGFKTMKASGRMSLNNLPEAEFSESGIAYGLESELIFPAFGYNWSIFIDVNHDKVKGEKDVPDNIGTNDRRAKFEYSAIQLAFGGRHYFYLSDNFKLFGNGLFVTNLVSDKSGIAYTQNGVENAKLSTERFIYNFALGAGVSYKKFNAELRYYTPPGLFRYEDGKFNKLMFTVNYAIF